MGNLYENLPKIMFFDKKIKKKTDQILT